MKKRRKVPERIRKVRRQKRRRRRLLLLLIPLILWVGRQIADIGYPKLKTKTPVATVYEESMEGRGVVVLRESVVSAGADGVVVYNAGEGQKVPVGEEVARINLLKDTSKLKDDLIKIQAALDYKNNVIGPSEKEYEITGGERQLVENIRDRLRDQDYLSVISAINQLDLNTRHAVNISELSELLEKSVEELEEMKKELSDQISVSALVYKSDFSGVVSYVFPEKGELPDYPESWESYTSEKILSFGEGTINSHPVKVKEKETIYRLIDNLSWNMALVVPDQENLPSVGTDVSLVIGDKSPIRGTVLYTKGEENQGVIVLNMEEGFEDHYKTVAAQTKVITKTEEGYRLPPGVLVESDQQVGVYVQDLHGLVRFVPVILLGEDERGVYVKRGDREDRIEWNGERKNTITVNDNVVIEPTKVQDKQLLS